MGHRQAAVWSDSSAQGFYVNNPLVTSTFSALFIQGCSHTCSSKAYYCKGFGASVTLLLEAMTLHPPQGYGERTQMWPVAHDGCDATQCKACEKVSHRGDAHKLDTRDWRGGKRENVIELSVAARVSKCKSAGMPTYVGKWENVLPLRAGCLQLYHSEKKKAKQVCPSAQVK